MQPIKTCTHTCKIIAHRGASGEYPENTVAAFCAAIEQRADMIEFDVQVTRDGVPVVLHDATDLMYDELPSDVLTLEEAMAVCTIPVNIEIKDGRCAQRVVEVVRPDTIVSCKDPEVLIGIQQFSTVDCELVCDNQFEQNIPLARRNNFKGINVPAEHVDEWLLRGAGLYRLRVKAYTVNSKDEARKLFQQGIYGVFTDFPAKIC